MGDHVVVAGAGLAGPLLAVYLSRRGHTVTLCERRPDPRCDPDPGGRSINLALSTRGIRALAGVGLAETVLRDAIPMRGRMLHERSGRQVFQSYSASGTQAINSVSRAALNTTLIDAALQEHGVDVAFENRVVDVDVDTGTVTCVTPAGPQVHRGDVVIGADGAHSAVRAAIARRPLVDYEQSYLSWGYKELSLPPRDGDFALDPHALHIWPRGGSMMIALPNPDRSFTCTLFWPHEGPEGFSSVDSPDALRGRFERDYPDALPLLPGLVEEFVTNPVGGLVTVRVWPWVVGRVALLGDAAHAIVPFYGQGMNCAFEDIVALDECLRAADDDWSHALSAYGSLRKPQADAIADLALDNFVEMRDKVGSPAFRARKRLEHALEGLMPGRYRSLYELVSFTTVPYAEARRIVTTQRRIAAAAAGTSVAICAAALASGRKTRRGR